MNCYLYDPPQYLFFASDLPELLYYSHIPALVLALFVGTFVFLNNPKSLQNRLLLLICFSFAIWVFGSLFAWTNTNSSLLLTIWPVFAVSAALISISSIYFIYVYLNQKNIPHWMKVIFLLLLTPVFIFAHTNLNVSGFDLTLCDAFAYEGLWYKVYYTSLSYVAILWISVLLLNRWRTADASYKKQIIFMGTGIQLFLFSFISTTSIVAYLNTIGLLQDSRAELFSLFSMTIFMVLIGILIVRFKAFNVGAHAADALMVALLILVASQYTYANSTSTTLILTTVTLALTAIAGALLIRSVRREIKQKEEIEQLAKKLAGANKRLRELDKMKSEFVSIASHQLRSPLTSIRGYASMLLDGSFGKLPAKAQGAVERIADSSSTMASSVEDYLNVSRIEAGNMKYELSDFNLKTEASRVADDKRQEAMKHGLLLTFKSKLEGHGIVNADLGKTRQILHNLVNNSIKYTQKGSIKIFVHDDLKGKQIHVDIIDTGIGMEANELESVFEKFQRAKNANTVNVTGTGLGLFVAQKMATKMGGSIHVTSAGPGEGSTFTLSLPLQM